MSSFAFILHLGRQVSMKDSQCWIWSGLCRKAMTLSESMCCDLVIFTKEASAKHAFINDYVWGLSSINHAVLAKGSWWVLVSYRAFHLQKSCCNTLYREQRVIYFLLFKWQAFRTFWFQQIHKDGKKTYLGYVKEYSNDNANSLDSGVC